MSERIGKFFRWLTRGRPMVLLDTAFTDCVSGKSVFYFLDTHRGHVWMAESRWEWCRVRCQDDWYTNWLVWRHLYGIDIDEWTASST